MAGTHKDPVLVVLQLSGGNDYLNTVIPYNNPLYRDNRPTVGIPDDQILHLDKNYGFHPAMAPLKKIWDDGKLAIMKTANGESPLVHGGKPILGCDVWEHSYYIDYRNRRPDYLKAFVDHLVNWEHVAEMYAAAK